jgi:glycosyltransferase involved in cell wall biosynthesis
MKISNKKILFVHQNFPGQFRHMASACLDKGYQVLALGHHDNAYPKGVNYLRYPRPVNRATGIHPWLGDVETKFLRAHAVRELAIRLKQQGFEPDAIVAHPGWGEALFLKEVWPGARLGLYAEFFYRAEGSDVGFDAEFASREKESASRLMMKNTFNYLQFPLAEAYLSPTHWQANTYPTDWQSRMSVIHEGVNTDELSPADARPIMLPNGNMLSPQAKVVTFVARNLEPYRGYHVFMRALAALQSLAPDTEILIIGVDATSYGSLPPTGSTWKDKFWDEVKASLRTDKIHFLGRLSNDKFLGVMQRSTVHVYLTYPFVLSWSLLEAMSLGKAIVASATAPVQEVMTDGREGLLVPFFDTRALSQSIATLLNDPIQRSNLGSVARQKVLASYDRLRQCLPQQIAWIDKLIQLPLRNT